MYNFSGPAVPILLILFFAIVIKELFSFVHISFGG